MEIFIKILLYVATVIIALLFVALWNFYFIVRPPQISANLVPEDFNLPREDVIIETKDNITLSGWLIERDLEPERKDRRAIILLHGYPAEKSDMLSIAASLYPDFTILLLDLRSFGDSSGIITTLGIKERADLSSALDFLSARDYKRVGVFGFSLAGAIGILTATKDSRVNALVSYASFSDLKSLGEDTYTNLFLLKKPMVWMMLMWSNIFLGESLIDISPVRVARDLTIPMLIAHSEGDEVIPFSHGERLKEALSSNEQAEFYFIQGRMHGDLPAEFIIKVREFFNDTL